MKKLLIILSLFTVFLKAEIVYSKLHEKIFEGIFQNKSEILIYNIGNPIYSFNKIKYTKEIYNSDIIYISEYYRIQIINDKPIFASSLIQLKYYKNSIGALYWEKGEPKIILLKNRLKKHNINVAKYLEKYVVDEEIYTF